MERRSRCKQVCFSSEPLSDRSAPKIQVGQSDRAVLVAGRTMSNQIKLTGLSHAWP